AYRVKPSNGSQEILAWRVVPNGKVKIKKVTASNNHLVAECPENYTLAGAQYGVYASQANASADTGRLFTLVTDAAGNSQEETLRAGTYYVKETEAPKGYAIDKKIYTVSVSGGQTATVTSADEPLFDPLTLRVTKKVAEDADRNLSVEGAEYSVKYYKEYLDAEQVNNTEPYRTWIFATDKKGIFLINDEWKVGGDELFKNDKGLPVGLCGTYVVEEVKAPAGFAKTEGIISLQHVKKGSTFDSVEILKDVIDIEKPQTISLTINKVDAETGKNEPQGYGTLAGAKYDVFFYDPAKSEDIKVATLTTDERGFARYEGGKPGLYKVKETDASKGYILDKEHHEIKARITEDNTANFNYAVESKETPIRVEIDKITIDTDGNKIPLAGVELQLLDKDKNVLESFTSEKNSHVIKGLAPGKYCIRETKTLEGYLAPEGDFEFTVKEIGTAQKVEIFNEPVPEIRTTASFDNGNKTSEPGENVTVVDAFDYKKIIAGQKYLVKGELINKATGKKVAEAEKNFTAENSKGKQEIKFKFNAENLAGADLVVTEKLYKITGNENKLLAIHEDLNDMDQTVCIPSIKTTAIDKKDGGKDLNAAEKQTITDKVAYTNLYPDREYTVKGILMSKATGKPVFDNGKEVTAEKKFKAEGANGFVELEFEFDASLLKGNTIVVFESLYENKIKVAAHSDIKDNNQSVYLPEIRTTATSQDDGRKSVLPVRNVAVSDKIVYKNLIAGQKYQVKGELLNAQTKEMLAETSGCFEAEETDGSVILDFTFDASKLKGADTVVFEELYKIDDEGEIVKKVAEHTDINDADQIVKVEKPEIRTNASFTDGKKEAQAADKMTVVDTVRYENLIAGKEYIVKGILMDKETGKPFLDNGKEVTVEKVFTAEKTEGAIELEFVFDGSNLKNRELVVFEDLYYGKEMIGTHSDLSDRNQTIKVIPVPTVIKTGDENNIILYVILITSATVAAALYRKRACRGREF
ncbi:MAG: VaFE repeat-containing surface-anchored protein, partial [Ruminococcus sp.]|nr:VaFE repeat-containing surface-anchored protein [Ruminococcus sp.]